MSAMRINQRIANGLRILHRWVGLYFIVLTLSWLIEAIFLPVIFSSGLPILNSSVPVFTSRSEGLHQQQILSIDQAIQTFIAQSPQGFDSTDDIDVITYFPSKGLYRLENKKKFIEGFIDGQDGELLNFGFNSTHFLQQQGLFGWFSPWIRNLLKSSSFLLTFILALSGFYLFINPFLIRNKTY